MGIPLDGRRQSPTSANLGVGAIRGVRSQPQRLSACALRRRSSPGPWMVSVHTLSEFPIRPRCSGWPPARDWDTSRVQINHHPFSSMASPSSPPPRGDVHQGPRWRAQLISLKVVAFPSIHDMETLTLIFISVTDSSRMRSSRSIAVSCYKHRRCLKICSSLETRAPGRECQRAIPSVWKGTRRTTSRRYYRSYIPRVSTRLSVDP